MNQLFYGDNLDVLRTKLKDDSVDLCYIDPPFNSKRNYFQIYNNVGKEDAAQAQAFIDTWTWNELAEISWRDITQTNQSQYTRQTVELITGLRAVLGAGSLLAYLVNITQRVNEIWRVLKPTGSFYLHCDPTCSHYLKLVLDSVFCPRGGDFRNEIIWKRQSAHNDARQKYAVITDSVFYYVKSGKSVFQIVRKSLEEKYVTSAYRYIDENGRRYRLSDLRSPNPRPNLIYDYKGYKPHPNGWAVSAEKMAQLDKERRLHFPKTTNGRIQLRRYLDENQGQVVPNLWDDILPLHGANAELLGYQTQKPEALLERIIQTSSNAGDVVLDAYCGCGTTVAVAQRFNRQWIGIDITYQSIAVILKRLEDRFGVDVVNQIQLSGIPRDMESARALANKQDDRLRKEFEKWAVLTYSNNRAVINDKKGADKGIDGMAYIVTGHNATARVLLQVKSGKVQRNDIATLRGDMAREQAVMGILITLEEPTKPMREEALAAGVYHYPLLQRDYPSIQIVTVREMIEDDRRSDWPMNMTAAVLKNAPAVDLADNQHDLQL